MAGRHIQWNLPGARGAEILGDMHLPNDPASAIATVLIAHGFLGYKDYGLFPRLAHTLAEVGCIAHRFNFSHSGMTNNTDTFEHPERFEQDTWMTQVADLHQLLDALDTDALASAGPTILLGHSRGGVSSLLAAAQRFRDDRHPRPDGVITLAAPDNTCSLPDDARAAMLERGYGEVVSNRTGQTLRIGSAWLREQMDDPVGHDVHVSAGAIGCPVMIIHGTDDPTVPDDCAVRLGEAARQPTLHLIRGANHVFNTPNPFPADPTEAPASPELEAMLKAVVRYVQELAN